MDIVTYKLSQKYADKVAAGFNSVRVDGLDIIFTLNNGETVTVTVPAPKDGKDGVSITDVSLNQQSHLICTLSDGTAVDAGLVHQGVDGKDGTNGSNGLDGKSAYQIWIDEGNSGTEQDFLDSLKGEGADTQEIESELSDLREENTRLKNDLNATTLSISAIGENVTLENTAEARFKKFEIHGNSKQEVGTVIENETVIGTMPSVEYPSEIKNVTGDVEVEVHNKNLCFLEKNDLFPASNGAVTTLENTYNIILKVNNHTNLSISGNYNLVDSNVIRIGGYNEYPTLNSIGTRLNSLDSNNKTINVNEYKYVLIAFYVSQANVTLEQLENSFQVEWGIPTTYVTHQKQTFTFPLGNEKLMLGDYLADDGIHHVRRQVVYDGDEAIFANTNSGNIYAYILPTTNKARNTTVLSNYFSQISTYNGGVGIFSVSNINVCIENISTVSEFKSWLSTHNLLVEYGLEEEVVVPYTAEQQAVYDQIKNTIKSYSVETNIYSTNEVSPVFDVVAYKDLNSVYVEDNNYVHTDNNYTTPEKNKLSSIAEGAQANVLENLTLEGTALTKNDKTIEIKDPEVTNARLSTTKGKNFESVDARIEELEMDVNDIKTTIGYVYGVRRKITNNSSPSWERILDSVGRFANATKDGENVQNDFDSLAPWSEIKSCNYDLTTKEINAWFGDPNFKFDGTNGDVFTYIPKTYWKIYQEDDYEYVLLADYPKEGFTEINSFFVGRYDCTDIGSKLRTYSGLVPTTTRTVTAFRDLVNALGSKFSQLDWRYFVLQMLYLVEYATYDSQTALGNGIMSRNVVNTLIAENDTNRVVVPNNTNFYIGQIIRIGTNANGGQVAYDRKITAVEEYDDGTVTGTSLTFSGASANIAEGNFVCNCAQQTGQCDILGMKSGCLNNDGYHSVIYRGMENIYGDVFKFVDGINIRDSQVYICKDHSQYQTDLFELPYKPLSYINYPTSNGWIKTLGFDKNEPFFRFPTELGGSSSTYLCDYYVKGTGSVSFRIGGCSTDAQKNGFWSLYTSGSTAGASWDRACRILIDS